jgi:glycosyltransferase involved in cell wall biosynthesis
MLFPKITVLMPVFNSEMYLREAISSILGQTLTDFEFLVFNDGSTDGSAAIVRGFTDKRIQFFDSQENYGYVYHLNEGIRRARGEYIARMDADDISHPDRFEKQIAFMDKNISVGLCGTWVHRIGEFDDVIEHPENDQAIRLALLNDSPLQHPSVMMRTSILKGNSLMYVAEMTPAEDYNLWVEMGKLCEIVNIPEILIQYRVHDAQISTRKWQIQQAKAQIVRNKQFETIINRPLSEEEVSLNAILFQVNGSTDVNLIPSLEKWIEKILEMNKNQRLYEHEDLTKLLSKKLGDCCKSIWFRKFIMAEKYSFSLLRDFLTSPDRPFKSFTPRQNLFFAGRCLLSLKRSSTL